MQSQEQLKQHLMRINGKGYKAYKDIAGTYVFPNYSLRIAHVQGDPFAQPSRIQIRVDRVAAGFKNDMLAGKSRNTALADFLTRLFHRNCLTYAAGNRGSGKSGLIAIERPVQEVLERNAMVVTDDYIEARFGMALPADNRRIAGDMAIEMFFSELPQIVNQSLFTRSIDLADLYRHLTFCEDADFLRKNLAERKLVAFIANGAHLPRLSGADPRPLDKRKAVLFKAPPSLTVSIDLPNQGTVEGMGIPEGVTLIVGGGYHGKSTLLNAIELGVYNHIPGDGRSLAVTITEAVKIKSADGRQIEGVDISPFINNLPFAKDTAFFSTPNASGSTSQAAAISEAVEMGVRTLLIDEDTSASNFMIRDHRMQRLVAKDQEPITPLIDRVRQLYEEKGISTILVMGGSGDYFPLADYVIQMHNYLPSDVTAKAHAVARDFPSGRIPEGGTSFHIKHNRIPERSAFNPYQIGNKIKINAYSSHELLFGTHTILFRDIEQIVDIGQARAIGHAIHFAMQFMESQRTLYEVVGEVMQAVDANGLDVLTPYCTGDLAHFRPFELAAVINRMRTLKINRP